MAEYNLSMPEKPDPLRLKVVGEPVSLKIIFIQRIVGARAGPDVAVVKRYWAIAGTLEQMTKQQLVEAVSVKTGREKAEVENVLEAALWSIAEALSSNERVDLRGFGSFTVKDKKERQGRNPRTGETITIAAKRDVSFKPGKELTEKLILPKTEAKPA